jgi:hypothetical protein
MTTQTMGTPRAYTTSNATRLLSAGAYLERRFRRNVIHELVACRFRFVAPSYGYDAVTVLAHALAARRLARKQATGMAISFGIDLVLFAAGVISWLGALLVAVWVVWAFAFLRRAATLQALSRLRATGTGDEYPASRFLTPGLVEKIAREQRDSGDAVFYGGYFPFVGAGWPLPDWSTAELLIPAGRNLVTEYFRRRDDDVVEDEGTSQAVIPFTVSQITDYVAKNLQARLREDICSGERIEHLTIERRKYSGAALAPVRVRWRTATVLVPPAPVASGADAAGGGDQDGRERYDATREYLCIRVGAWDEELVISMFVGFDLRGNTLYSEFHPYVMPPGHVTFHLVDRLPERLTLRLLLRVARHASLAWTGAVPSGWVGAVLCWIVAGPLGLLVWWLIRRRRGGGRRQDQARPAISLEPVIDGSDLRLGRYAGQLIDRGAMTSVRELAVAPNFHHFFQEGDQAKYIKIVERQLLQVKAEFLAEHNVDLGDHARNETNIIDGSTQNFSDFTINGSENFTVGQRRTYNYNRTGKPQAEEKRR